MEQPKNRSGRFGRQESALCQPEFEPPFVCLPAGSFFTILTENMRILVRNRGEVTQNLAGEVRGNDREETGCGMGK